LLDWLAQTGSQVFIVSAWAFVLVNGAVVAAVFLTRDRTLVNRWTGRLLAVNVALVGAGLGVPLLTSVARLAVTAISPSLHVTIPANEKAMDEAAATAGPGWEAPHR
jgi:hypothetical protein